MCGTVNSRKFSPLKFSTGDTSAQIFNLVIEVLWKQEKTENDNLCTLNLSLDDECIGLVYGMHSVTVERIHCEEKKSAMHHTSLSILVEENS